jgi:hypothetical protein
MGTFHGASRRRLPVFYSVRSERLLTEDMGLQHLVPLVCGTEFG